MEEEIQKPRISGSRELSDEEVERINRVKALAQACGAIIDEMFEEGDDARCASIAKTELQTGFMWAVRAIAKPDGF